LRKYLEKPYSPNFPQIFLFQEKIENRKIISTKTQIKIGPNSEVNIF
jgi:hypothetical protein